MHFFDVRLSCILSIDQDIVQVYYNKDIKLFSKNLVDIALKAYEYIEKAEKHHLALKMAVPDTKSRLPLITFSNSYLMIGINEIQLSKSLDLA